MKASSTIYRVVNELAFRWFQWPPCCRTQLWGFLSWGHSCHEEREHPTAPFLKSGSTESLSITKWCKILCCAIIVIETTTNLKSYVMQCNQTRILFQGIPGTHFPPSGILKDMWAWRRELGIWILLKLSGSETWEDLDPLVWEKWLLFPLLVKKEMWNNKKDKEEQNNNRNGNHTSYKRVHDWQTLGYFF